MENESFICNENASEEKKQLRRRGSAVDRAQQE